MRLPHHAKVSLVCRRPQDPRDRHIAYIAVFVYFAATEGVDGPLLDLEYPLYFTRIE